MKLKEEQRVLQAQLKNLEKKNPDSTVNKNRRKNKEARKARKKNRR